MRWPGLPSRTPIGIDIGGQYIKAAQLGRNSHGWCMRASACVPRAGGDDPIDAGEVRRLCGVLYRQGFALNKAVVAVPPEKLLHGMLDLPPAKSGAPLGQIARMELARMHGCDPQAFEMACWELPPSARSKGLSQVLATACRHGDADALLDVLEEGGLDVRALDTHARALVRACTPLLAPDGGIVGILDVGWNSCHLIVVKERVIIYERALPEAGCRHLAKTFAEHLHLETRDWELLLLETPSQTAPPDAPELFREVGALAWAHFEGLLEDLQVTFSYAMEMYPGAPVERLLLAGGGASIRGLGVKLASALGVETRVVSPTDLVECPAPVPNNPSASGLTAAVGLAQLED